MHPPLPLTFRHAKLNLVVPVPVEVDCFLAAALDAEPQLLVDMDASLVERRSAERHGVQARVAKGPVQHPADGLAAIAAALPLACQGDAHAGGPVVGGPRREAAPSERHAADDDGLFITVFVATAARQQGNGNAEKGAGEGGNLAVQISLAHRLQGGAGGESRHYGVLLDTGEGLPDVLIAGFDANHAKPL